MLPHRIFFYDLAERVTDIRIESRQRTGVLGFDDGCVCISTVKDDDIWSAIVGFVVGLDLVATDDEDADKSVKELNYSVGFTIAELV